jgi:hypothetical protein
MRFFQAGFDLAEMFEIYIDDDRYAVPTFKLVEAEDEGAAVILAGRMLSESGHHRGVEMCREGRRLIGLGSFVEARKAPPQGLV